MSSWRAAGAFARARRLAPLERRLTVEAGLLLVASLAMRRVLSTGTLLRVGGMEDAARSGRREIAGSRHDPVTPRVQAVERAARLLGLSNCLVKATALRLLLRRGGMTSTLHIGVRKAAGENGLAAHAWVSVDGRVVLGAEELHRPYAEMLHRMRARTTAAR